MIKHEEFFALLTNKIFILAPQSMREVAMAWLTWSGVEWSGVANNVPGGPVFSVMAASWFGETSGWIGKVEGMKPVLLKKSKQNNGFQPATILRRRIFTRMKCELADFIRFDSSRVGYHLVLGFSLYIRCRLVAV
jgi:hypothetical protein